MSMSLRGRLNRLGHAPRRPGSCEICGVDPTAPIRYEVTFAGDDPEVDRVSSEACPRCGYREWTVIGWDGDLITNPEQVRAEREELERLQRKRDEFLSSRPDLTEGQVGAQVPDYPPSEDRWGGGSSL